MNTSENTNTETAEQTTTVTDQQQALQEAVDTASDLLVVARDQKNTGITLLTAPADEVAAVRSFVSRVQQQQAASKNIASLALAKAKERNAGKKLPPSKQNRGKKAAANGDAAKA